LNLCVRQSVAISLLLPLMSIEKQMLGRQTESTPLLGQDALHYCGKNYHGLIVN